MKSFSLYALVLLLMCGHIQAQKLSAAKITNRSVRYAPHAKFKTYPLPAVNFQRSGLATEKERTEIINKIVYPLVNESPRPVAAVVVELVPVNPHAMTQAEIGFNKITVLVIWHDGYDAGALFEKNADGHFDKDAYRIFLATGEDECPHEEDSAPPSRSNNRNHTVATRARIPRSKLRRQ